MALKDVLWACPACHAIESIAPDGRCQACDARLRRGRGALIVLNRAGAAPEERSVADWLAQLPWPDLDAEGLSLPGGITPPFEAAVLVRTETHRKPLRLAGDYIGTIEVFGEREPGTLTLDLASIAFTPDPATVGWCWPLADLAAIQPASSTIQLKVRGGPVASLRFRTGSVRLWEQRLKFCTRHAWNAAGRGRILEFQPRIRAA